MLTNVIILRTLLSRECYVTAHSLQVSTPVQGVGHRHSTLLSRELFCTRQEYTVTEAESPS